MPKWRVKFTSPQRRAVALAIVVSFFGFGVLAILWAALDWPDDVPGLFDYASATLGDGLLLPLLVAVLATVAFDREPPSAKDQRRWLLAAAMAGLLLGAATQVVWLADSNPRPNWSFPRAHHFNFAGWYHAVFLCTAAALLSALAVGAVRRIRFLAEAEPERVDRLAASPWLGVVFASGIALVGLIAVDNRPANETTAGIATAIAITIATAFGLVLLIIAFGRRLLRGLPTLSVGLAAAAGLTAVAGWGLQSRPLIAGVSIFAALLLSAALLEPPELTLPAVGRMVAIALLLLGAISVALELATAHGAAAILILGAAAAAAVRIGGLGERRAGDNAFLVLGVFFVCAAPVLADWLDDRSPSSREAATAVAAAEGLIELLVFGLVRDRFRDFMSAAQAERAWRPGDPEPPPEPSASNRTWFLIIALAVPALAGIACLYIVAGETLNTDAGAGGAHDGLVPLLVVGAAAMVIAAVAIALAPERAEETPKSAENWAKATVEPVPAATVAAALALAVWAVALLVQFDGELHFVGFALAVAFVLAAVAAEDLIRSPVELQLVGMSARAWFVVAMAFAVYLLAVFWLVADGLWVGGKPASVGGALAATAIVSAVTAALCAAVAFVLGRGLPTPHITERPPEHNGAADQLMFMGLVLFGAAVPAFIVGRVEAQDVDNAGLVTLAGVGLVFAFVGVYMWITGLNAAHATYEKGIRPPQPILDVAAGDEDTMIDLNDERIKRLEMHVRFTNRVSRALLIGSAIWVALQLG